MSLPSDPLFPGEVGSWRMQPAHSAPSFFVYHSSRANEGLFFFGPPLPETSLDQSLFELELPDRSVPRRPTPPFPRFLNSDYLSQALLPSSLPFFKEVLHLRTCISPDLLSSVSAGSFSPALFARSLVPDEFLPSTPPVFFSPLPRR